VNGYVGPTLGVANFTIDPPPPGNFTPAMSVRSTDKSWYAAAELLNVPLDSAVNYTLTVSTEPTTAGAGVFLDDLVVFSSADEVGPFGPPTLDYWNYKERREGKRPGKVDVGALAGGVVGAEQLSSR
jgi:hypothetical protein